MLTPFPKPDLSLLRSWNWAMEHGGHPTEKPYIAVRTALGKTLVFLAARHQGPGSPTFQTIDHLFDRFNPQAVVIEGVSPAQMQEHKDFVQEQADMGFIKSREPAYTAWQAYRHNIDVIPGELPHEKELEAIIQHGFTAMDLAGYYTVLSVQNDLQNGISITSAYPERILNSYARDYNAPGHCTMSQFEEWYKRRMNALYSADHVRQLDNAPHDDDNDTRFIQSIGRYIDRVREPHIVSVIGEQLTRTDVQTLAVVYGGDHHLVQGPVWDALLAPPHIIKAAPALPIK